MKKVYFFISFTYLILCSCSEDMSIKHYQVAKIKEKNSNAEQISLQDLQMEEQRLLLKKDSRLEEGISWKTPPQWQEVQASGMRMGSFKAGEDGDCSVLVLAGDGGGFAANVNRWRAQLGLNALADRDILTAFTMHNGKIAYFFFLKIENPQLPMKSFLTAIYPLKEKTIFIKLSDKLEKINSHKAAFLNFCQSISIKSVKAPK